MQLSRLASPSSTDGFQHRFDLLANIIRVGIYMSATSTIDGTSAADAVSDRLCKYVTSRD